MSRRDDPELQHAAQVIREVREGADISLQELAERLEWHKSRLSRYETNERALHFSSIEAIANALEIRTDVLMLRIAHHLYPELASSESKIGKTLRAIVEQSK